MPFVSEAQSRLMHAVAGNKALSKKLGIPMKTAKEMVKKGQHGKGSISKLPEMVKKK